MKNPFVYGVNVIKVLILRIRGSKKTSVGWIQSFEKIRVVIKNNGTIDIGNFNQNRENLYIETSGGDLKIGNHCFFNINCSITCLEKIEIGDNCKFGNNLVMVDHDHNFKSDSPEFITSPILIGNNVWVGANVTILRGTVIEDNCVIAAGSVVKGCIPNNSIYIKGKIKKRER